MINSTALPSLADGDPYSQYLDKVKGRGWMCKVCAKVDKNKANMRLHIDVNHINARYVCPFCQYVNKTEDSRRKHIIRVHEMKMSCTAISDLVSSGGPENQVDKQDMPGPEVMWR